MNTTEQQLNSGLSLITIGPFAGLGAVYCEISLPVGTAREAAGERGFAHAVEHVIASSIEAAIEGDGWVGSYISPTFYASTQLERTTYQFAVAMDDLAMITDIVSRIFTWPEISTDELANMLAVMHEEALDEAKDLDAALRAAAAKALFGDETLGVAAAPTDATIDELRAFWVRHYQPGHAALVVAGNADAKDLAARLYKAQDGATIATQAPALTAPAAGDIVVVGGSTEQARFALHFVAEWDTSQDLASLDCLYDILHRYVENCLRDKGLIYDLEVESTAFRGCSIVTVGAQCAPDKSAVVYSELHAAIDALPAKLLGRSMAKFVADRRRSLAFERYYPLSWAEHVSEYYHLTGRVVGFDELDDHYAELDAAELRKLALSVFGKPELLVIGGKISQRQLDAITALRAGREL